MKSPTQPLEEALSGTNSIVCCKRNLSNAGFLPWELSHLSCDGLGIFDVSHCELVRLGCFNIAVRGVAHCCDTSKLKQVSIRWRFQLCVLS